MTRSVFRSWLPTLAIGLGLFFSVAGSIPLKAQTGGTITGTVLGATEADIRSGGKTIIITLANDTWAAAGASFDAQRQAIIGG